MEETILHQQRETFFTNPRKREFSNLLHDNLVMHLHYINFQGSLPSQIEYFCFGLSNLDGLIRFFSVLTVFGGYLSLEYEPLSLIIIIINFFFLKVKLKEIYYNVITRFQGREGQNMGLFFNKLIHDNLDMHLHYINFQGSSPSQIEYFCFGLSNLDGLIRFFSVLAVFGGYLSLERESALSTELIILTLNSMESAGIILLQPL